MLRPYAAIDSEFDLGSPPQTDSCYCKLETILVSKIGTRQFQSILFVKGLLPRLEIDEYSLQKRTVQKTVEILPKN
jgi:hypothetical protein